MAQVGYPASIAGIFKKDVLEGAPIQSRRMFYDSVSETWFAVGRLASDSDFYICKWDGVTPSSHGDDANWVSEGYEVHDRNTEMPSIWWDDANRTLHSVGFHSTPEYTKSVYNGTTWTLSPLRESVSAVNGSGISSSMWQGGFVVDSNELPWYIYINTSFNMIANSRDGGTWGADRSDLQSGFLSNGDFRYAAFQWKDDDGDDAIAVVMCNDNTDDIEMVSRKDSAAVSAAWTTVETGVAVATGCDNHLSVCPVLLSGDTTSTIVVAFKEKSGSSSYFNTVRKADGTWEAVETIAGGGETVGRVKVFVHGETAHFFATEATGGGAGNTMGHWTKVLPDSAISSREVFMQTTSTESAEVGSPWVPHGAVDGAIDVPILAGANATEDGAWMNVIAGVPTSFFPTLSRFRTSGAPQSAGEVARGAHEALPEYSSLYDGLTHLAAMVEQDGQIIQNFGSVGGFWDSHISSQRVHWQPGITGRSPDFIGGSGATLTGPPLLPRNGGAHTCALLLRCDTNYTNPHVMAGGDGSSNTGWSWSYNPSRVRFTFGGVADYIFSYTPVLGREDLIVCRLSKDNGTVSIVIYDPFTGAELGRESKSVGTTNGGELLLEIGGSSYSNPAAHYGPIYWAAHWQGRELTEQEAMSLAKEAMGGWFRKSTGQKRLVPTATAAAALEALLVAATADADAKDVTATLGTALAAALAAATADADAKDVTATLGTALAAALTSATGTVDAQDVTAVAGGLVALLVAATADADGKDVTATLGTALTAALTSATADVDAQEVTTAVGGLVALLVAATATVDAKDLTTALGNALTATLLVATADVDAQDVTAVVGTALTAALEAALVDVTALNVTAGELIEITGRMRISAEIFAPITITVTLSPTISVEVQ